MKRRLFLTGPVGCGKSTAIVRALGDKIAQCGGFLTRRYREPRLHFTLESPDGSFREIFLDFPGGKPVLTQNTFSVLGTQLLLPRKNDKGFAPCIMDEIGGIELLNPEFSAMLDRVLGSDIPILGVLKGEGPAGALTDSLGLSDEYGQAAFRLRQKLKNDPPPLLYECGQYDENALLLAKRWVEEYLHD